VRIVLEDADEDGVGRVCVRSASAARGYHPAPTGLAADDVVLGNRRFRTADLARRDEHGQLHLVGRVHDVVNVGGRKVYPAEIERVIRTVPGVHDVVVTGVARSATTARYKVPRSIEIVPALPRTARGKIDRRALDAREPID
jgi:acyl-CoA synthetase (AMP-forming)/AMP-acid ligase II